MKNTDCSVCVLFKISCVTDESVSEEFMTHSYKKISWTSPPMWPEDHTPTQLSPSELSRFFSKSFLIFFLILHPWGPCYSLIAEMEGMIKLKISTITVSDYKGSWYVSWVIMCSVVQSIRGSFNLRHNVYLSNDIHCRWLDIWFQVHAFHAHYKWNGEGKKLDKATWSVISIQRWIKWFTSTKTVWGGRGKNGGGQKVDLNVQCSRSHSLQ